MNLLGLEDDEFTTRPTSDFGNEGASCNVEGDSS